MSELDYAAEHEGHDEDEEVLGWRPADDKYGYVVDIPALNSYAKRCHEANLTWWHDPSTGQPKERNKGELLMLMVSELAEAMEGERKNLMDDKLTHRRMAEVELADCLIRIFDYAGGYGYDLDGAFEEKMTYNAQRANHRPEERLKEGGKKW